MAGIFCLLRSSAEGVGFEPTVTLIGHNGFRDRPIRPLWHPSLITKHYTKRANKSKLNPNRC